MNPPQPIVTLITDFGQTDSYVAQMKGVLLSHCPQAILVDITHELAPHDILSASLILERIVRVFPPGTIHLVVVDPGVGSPRKIALADTHHNQQIIAPDNGLLTWIIRRGLHLSPRELTWRPATTPSPVFHGRDIMAPAAGMLAAGASPQSLAANPLNPILLDITLGTSTGGSILHIDRFGNATTNIPADQVPPSAQIRIHNHTLSLRRTYSDVPPGQPLALIGSADLLEIAVNQGSAARQLQLRTGEPVQIA